MNENVNELSPKQHTAINALIAQSSIDSAAKQAGVTQRTLYRWLDDTAFRLALNGALDKALDCAARGLVRLTDKAIRVVETVLDDTELHPATRLRAADLVLANVIKLVELRTLAQRVAALEERQHD